jgi:hypothetical protein
MSGTQLNNVAMDLDGFLRTYGACEKKPSGLSIHVSRYPYVNSHVNGRAREHLRGHAE